MAKDNPKYNIGDPVKIRLSPSDENYRRLHGKVYEVNGVATTHPVWDYFIIIPGFSPNAGFGEEELETAA